MLMNGKGWMCSLLLAGASLLAAVESTARAQADDPSEASKGPKEQVSFPDAPKAGYVRVPNGWTHKSCLHEIPDDAEVVEQGDTKEIRSNLGKVLKTIPKCQYDFIRTQKVAEKSSREKDLVLPTINGWAEMSEATTDSSRWFTEIITSVVVPRAPSSQGDQVIFLFNSFQDNGCEILQPVLMWGANGTGSGKFWTMADWRVNVCNGITERSTFRSVNVSDLIRLSITATSCREGGWCDWRVSYRLPNGSTYSKTFNQGGPYRRAERGVLEVYRVTACNQLPSSEALFWNTWLYQGNALNWNGRQEVGLALGWSATVFGVSPTCNWNIWNDGRDVHLQYN